jgi:hypothetical protein
MHVVFLLQTSLQACCQLVLGLLDAYLKMQDTKRQQWACVESWMQGVLEGKQWPYMTQENALELVPLAHKVCKSIPLQAPFHSSNDQQCSKGNSNESSARHLRCCWALPYSTLATYS